VIITGPSVSGKSTLHCCLSVERNFLPVPVHTTRSPRYGEVPGIDAIFVSEDEYFKNHDRGIYIEESPDVGFFANAYYGSPKSWIASAEYGIIGCYVSPTIRVARIVKERSDGRVIWIHLDANETVRRRRLAQRSPESDKTSIQARIHSAPPRSEVMDCDMYLDTSYLSAGDIIRRVNGYLNSVE
jgi:guanylate kinase